MRTTMLRCASGALALIWTAAAGYGLGCSGCPDLAVRAFEFEVDGADPGEVLITVTNEGGGTVVCADTAIAEACTAGKGVYTMSFKQGGVVFGELTGICTAGDATGCAAEDAEAEGQPPLIRVVHDASGWTLTLERQGACP
jgi:hypothetical protein